MSWFLCSRNNPLATDA